MFVFQLNDPDTYASGAPGDPHSAALRAKTALTAPVVEAVPSTSVAAAPPPQETVNVSPATTAPAAEPTQPKVEESSGTASNVETSASKTVEDGNHKDEVEEGHEEPTGNAAESGGKSDTATAKPEEQPQQPTANQPLIPKDPDASPATAASV